MILWGPPGVGKTTLAQIIAKMTKSDFIPFSAVLSGIKEIKEIMAAAEKGGALDGGPFSSSMKSIGSTKRNRMRSCRMSSEGM